MTQTTVKPLTELALELLPSVEQEVRDLVGFFLTKHDREPGNMLRQDLVGALEDYRMEFTSLELQEKGLDWRST